MGINATEANQTVAQPRPEIAESLSRSAALDIDPNRTAPYIGDLSRGERISWAAQPLIDELCGLIRGVGTAVVLTDDQAQVHDVRTGDADLTRYFRDNGGMIGSGWSEELMGTTAIALAIKHGRPMGVTGEEHYIARLKDCSAVAAPIFDPFARTLVGGLVLSGREASSSPHMLAVVVQAASAIERRLYEEGCSADHLLLSRFAATAGRQPGEAVFVINERMLLSNDAATQLLRTVERSTLWNQALDTVAGIRGTEATNLLTLRDGRSLIATFEKADPDSARAGILVRVAPAGGEAGASATISAPGGRSGAPDRYLEREMTESVELTGGLLIIGEPGSGKLSAAEEIHRRSGRHKLAIVDGGTDLVSGGPGMLRDLAATASDPESTLVVRHVECLSQRAVTTIRSLLSNNAQRARLIATMTAAAYSTERTDLRDLFPHQFHVPPLRDRSDELRDIVRELMQRHGASGQMQPAALRALALYEWPGNIRELDAVISKVVASRRTCDISVRDLPATHIGAGSPRRLTRMEHVERSAIQQALLEAEGNRTQAAAILQIGRATLYRKIKSYGLDVAVDAGAAA